MLAHMGESIKIIRCFVNSKWFRSAVTALVCLNAGVIGLHTIPAVRDCMGTYLRGIDKVCLGCFALEMVLKLYAFRWRFFSVGWNCFDFVVIGLSLVPQLGVFSSVRLFRYMRVLRLITRFRHLRLIVRSIVVSLPGIGWTAALLILIFYVYAIIGVSMFGEDCPGLFGTLPCAFYSLFQLMTLDGWATEVVNPVVKLHLAAWWYFISFILISSFVLMNVVVGILVNSMSEASNRTSRINRTKVDERIEETLVEFQARLKRIEELLNAKDKETPQ